VLDLAAAYEETHDHLADLVRDLPGDSLRAIVPASPDWDVKDVVAHVTAEAADAVSDGFPERLDLIGALDDPAEAAVRERMTARHVAERRDRSITEVLDEWNGLLPDFLPMMRGERSFPRDIPFLSVILLNDVAVHAQDVRGALRMPGDRESAGVGSALGAYSTVLGLRLDRHAVPALRIRYGQKERIAGSGEPEATWEGDRFEIFRALSGRRSTDQILAMSWSGDPTPYVELIPAFGPRTDPIIE
jgi:uncharacterized protein (TIGR03083 family)